MTSTPASTAADVRSDQPILLFYDGFEEKAIDAFWGAAASTARGLTRRMYRAARRRQPYTGYYTAFRNLVRSLTVQGLDVRVNDFAAARRSPDRAIGISGYRSVFPKLSLSNPALVFHADFGTPDEILNITASVNAQLFALGCAWPRKLYEKRLGDRMRSLFVAIDVNAWPDLSDRPKSVDYLIYDKIRWRRDARAPELLDVLRDEMDKLGRSHETLRYGHHDLSAYRQALARSRAMVFLCEHETQGLAYQEAMSSNLPILAWNEGELVDPHQRPFLPEGEHVSAVPYFDETCGMTFTVADARRALQRFDKAHDHFTPRRFVEHNLSLRAGADAFLALYEEVERLGRTGPPAT